MSQLSKGMAYEVEQCLPRLTRWQGELGFREGAGELKRGFNQGRK